MIPDTEFHKDLAERFIKHMTFPAHNAPVQTPAWFQCLPPIMTTDTGASPPLFCVAVAITSFPSGLPPTLAPMRLST